ncbi:MAG TPA: archease [candidate division Zixibacteria bacterium]|nr:archease [candidate division Zixibacteria bacterium]
MAFSVERIDHDADIGIAVTADSAEELFRASAMGMLEILLDRSEVESRTVRIVSASSTAMDLLLVDFLSEILDLVLFDRFAVQDVQIGELSDKFIVAEIAGQRELPEGAIIREIKGVTFHQLALERTESGEFTARVIFDI